MNAHARKLLTTLGGTFWLLLASMAAGILLDRAGIGIASATYDIVGFPVIEVRQDRSGMPAASTGARPVRASAPER